MNVKLRPEKYLKYLYLPNLFGTQRTKEILLVNPTTVHLRQDAEEVSVFVYDYDADIVEESEHSALVHTIAKRNVHQHATETDGKQ